MSYVDGRVDMRLPADFVDGAALPVVLDPLVGTAFGTNGLATAFDDENLDVAYDATEDVYLATWTRKFASGVTCVRGQRINDVGNLVGGVETIACPGNYVAGSARVANVASQDAFLVVFYTTDHDILGSAVSASPTPGPGGGASAVTVILDNADDLIGPDVGGEATELDDEAIVVWANSTQGSIQAKQVHLDGAVTPPTLTPLAAVVDIATSSGSATHTYASISNSGGQTGDHLIAFNTTFSFSPNTTVRGTVVSRDLVIRDMSFEVSQWFLGDCDFPSVDGDGRAWVVAYEAEASPGTFDNDIEARAVVYSSSAGGGVDISSIATISDQLLANERNAQVCWLGDSALVTYETNAGTSGTNIYRAAAQPVDLLTARPCGGGGFASSPNGSGADHEGLRGVSKAAGGAWSEDDALMVWSERDAVSSVNTGYAQRYRADDGVNVTLGGRCGSPGYGYASNAKVGNADFAARLVDSRPGQAAWLVFSSTRIDLPCGACTLVPDPFQGILLATTTSAAGVADVALPIPNDPSINGAVFFHQWLVSLPAGTLATCASLGTEVSDALQTTIQ